MDKTIKFMLNEVQTFIEHNTAEKQKNGNCFNLLEVSGINTLEVKMCRILAEIINPHGSHHQGSVFLKSFVSEVLKIEMTDDELEKSTVITEYLTDKNRRIDIVITTKHRFIPIEVKLYAKDQENQCADYYNYANSKSDIPSKVFYLTIDGHLPHEDNGLKPVKYDDEIIGYEEIIPISFITDICRWLGIINNSVLNKPMLYASFFQFKTALEKLGGNMDKELNTKVIELISGNSDYMRSAMVISDSVTRAKENLLLNLFERFEKEINNSCYPLERLNNKFDYKYDNYCAIHNYYKKKTFPALVYKYKNLDDNNEVWFMIELSSWGGLYCGFVIAENGDNPRKLVVSDEEIAKCFKRTFNFNKDEWWFYWRYIPEHIDEYLPEASPDFKQCNEAYMDLFDNEKYDKFIRKCILKLTMILHNTLGE